MKKEDVTGYFRDDGSRIDPERITRPTLCGSCLLDGNPEEEILCTLTRADQEGEEDFLCGSYRPRA